MNLQEDRCSPKEIQVNTLADRSKFDISCDIDNEHVAELNNYKKQDKDLFLRD